MEYKVIKPKSPNKLRDIEIAIDSFNTSVTETAKKYGVSRTRVDQIRRGYLARLSMQLNNVGYIEAFRNPVWYLRADAIDVLLSYRNFLLTKGLSQ